MIDYVIEIVQKGLLVTVLVSVASWLVAFVLGVLLGIVGDSRMRVLREAQFFLSTVLRGFPELLAIYLVFFGVRQFVNMNAFVATVVALGITQTGFFSEGARAALQLVPQGQRDAAMAFGFKRMQVYRIVLLPQMFRALVPPALNMFLGLLKLSTYAAAIGLAEVLYISRTIINRDYQVIPVSVAVAVIFIAISVPLSRIVNSFESRRSRTISSSDIPLFP